MKYLLATLFLSVCLPGQVVRLANHSSMPFRGWKRATIDILPPHAAGAVGGATYVLGRQVGSDVHIVDVRVQLQPGEHLTLDLATATPVAFERGAFPANPAAFFGGPMTIAGQEMQLVSIAADGAGYTLHMRKRTQPMMCVDVWFTWYPDQPGWCQGEVAMTASDPTVPDMGVVVDPGFPLQFGNSLTLPLGGEPWNLLPSGITLADGQARILPLTFVWLPYLQEPADWMSMIAASEYAVGGVGISRLLPDGNPEYPPGFTATWWMEFHRSESVRRLHTFEAPVVGPAPRSAVSGQQEDQMFVRGEALFPEGAGAEIITYLSALKMAARPCHHLEPNGALLEPSLHVNPRLVIWEGRVHWNPILSPDRLGKSGTLNLVQTKGWWGADVEHWLINTLAAATRLTGSPACQWLLSTQARLYMLQSTTTPGLATTQPFAARAVGYEGIGAVHLWRELEDRGLAAAVQTHWQSRVTNVIVPAYGNRPQNIWDPRFDDPRLGKGWWYHPWQQALGAYGLDLGCTVLGPSSGRAVALAAAQAVIRDSFVNRNGRWENFAAVALDGRVNQDPIFYLFGSPMAPAVVLRHDANDSDARTIWQQMHDDATWLIHFTWFAPGILP